MATKLRSDAKQRYDAKTMVATYHLDDLIRTRPDPGILEIEPAEVDVEITFPKNVGATAWKKFFLPVISAEVARYQEIIEAEIATLATKVEEKGRDGDVKGAKRMVESTQKSVAKAVATLDTQLPALLDAELVRLAKRDRKLRNHNLKVAVKVGRILFKVGANIATLVGSAGADVTAWMSIVRAMKDSVQLIVQETKSEQKLKVDLHRGYKAFLEDIAATRKPADKALRAYRNKNTKLKNEVMRTAKRADGLVKEMRSAKDLRSGVAAGAQAMQMSRKVGTLVDRYRDIEDYADTYAEVLEDSQRRLLAFVKDELAGKYELLVEEGRDLDTFLAYAETFYGYLEEVADNIEEIAGAA